MKKEKMSRRKEQGAETKKRIYRIAEELFNKHGINEVSVDDIVGAAGVSKGTFYVHFESKDALFSSLISEYVDKVDMDYEAFIKTLPPDTPAPDLLMAIVGEIFHVIERTIGYEKIRTLYKIQLADPARTHKVTSYTRLLYQMLGDVLEIGVRRGEFETSLPVDRLTRHLIMAMRGLVYEWCMRYPDFDLKEQALTHFGILLKVIQQKSE